MIVIKEKLTNLGLSHAIPLSNIVNPIISQSGLNVFLCGGIVRDALLRRPSKDMDIVVEGNPQQMQILGDQIYSQLSEKMKTKYELDIRQSGLNTNLRSFLQSCGGGVLLSFLLYLNGQTDIAPVIYPRFLVAMTKIQGEDIEFVATRSENYSEKEGVGSRNRNPKNVNVAGITEDAFRRDFTVNALYVDLSTGNLIDPTGMGLTDLKNKTIRVTRNNDPEVVFLEDPLRILRAIRQSTQLGFTIDPKTANIIKNLVQEKGYEFFSQNGSVSEERIRDELCKILLSKAPTVGLNGLLDLGVLDIIMPEVAELARDKEINHRNLWEHTLGVINKVTISPEIEAVIENTAPKVGEDPSVLRSKTLLRLRLSALLHDVGKVESRSYGEVNCPICGEITKINNAFTPICQNCGKIFKTNQIGEPTFHDHQVLSEQKTDDILRRLKFDSQMIDWVKRDCALHMVHFDQYVSDETTPVDTTPGEKQKKKTLVEKCIHNLADTSYPNDPWSELNFTTRMYGLIRADSSANPDKQQARLDHFIQQYEASNQLRENEKRWQDFNKPILSGGEIMSMFGVRQGKWIGDIQNRIKEDKLNNPESYSRERAIQIAQEELGKWGSEIYNK